MWINMKCFINCNSLQTTRRSVPALLFLFLLAFTHAAEKVKVVLVGDSTVASTYGWGIAFPEHLKPGVSCVNLARNGRSSKSYRTEGMWKKVLDEKPQWIFIQFGHNDEPGKGPERETDPNTTYKENLARYIDEARAIGAQPIVVTSLVRRNFNAEGKIVSSLTPYAEAVKKVAEEKHVPCIDLHSLSTAEMNSIGAEAAKDYNPAAKGKDGKPDITHLSPVGQVATANLVANEVRKVVPAFRDLFAESKDTPAFDAIVASDGSGQFKSVNDAISKAEIQRSSGKGKPWVILVKNGEYKERVYVQRERGHIHLVGEDSDKTSISFNMNANMTDAEGKKIGTFATPTFTVDGDDMKVENLTIANTAGNVGQALALRVDADRVTFNNCRFLGYQDTILTNRGRQYFNQCYIEGAVDFFFGAATAYFDRCHIHCTGDGYITAASTPENAAYGYVFSNCKITAVENAKVYLGRPWRSFAKTVFLQCDLPKQIRPEGWHNWNKPDAEQTAFYAEYASKGDGAIKDQRAAWSKQLDEKQAATYTKENVLGAW